MINITSLITLVVGVTTATIWLGKLINESVQSVNELFAANVPRQTALTRGNMLVSLSSVIIAIIIFISGILSKPETGVIKQLQQNNELLRNQMEKLNLDLKKQNDIDSMLIKLIRDTIKINKNE